MGTKNQKNKSVNVEIQNLKLKIFLYSIHAKDTRETLQELPKGVLENVAVEQTQENERRWVQGALWGLDLAKGLWGISRGMQKEI